MIASTSVESAVGQQHLRYQSVREARTQVKETTRGVGGLSMLQQQGQWPCDVWTALAHQRCQQLVWPKGRSFMQDE